MKLFLPTKQVPDRLKNLVFPVPEGGFITTDPDNADGILFPWIISDGIVQIHSSQIICEILGIDDFQERHKRFDELQQSAIRKVVDGFYQKLVRRYSQCVHKKMIVLVTSDYSDPYWFSSNLHFFRTSLYRSMCLSNEEVLPYLRYGNLLQDIELSVLEVKGSRPTVGFCGSIVQGIRKKLLFSIMKHPDIADNFIGRSGFFHALCKKNPENKKQLQQEYIDNLCNNMFIVCCRGAGNYSIRFYETLQVGRIPILIDSDMSFPFADQIPWDEIVICKPTAAEVIETMLDWYRTKDLMTIQRNARMIWETFLSREGFMRQLGKKLPDIL